MTVVRIPRRFYDDCVDCETLTPPVVRKTKTHYFVDLCKADPDYEGATVEETQQDFVSRAVLYADPKQFGSEYRYLQQSARATLNAIYGGK